MTNSRPSNHKRNRFSVEMQRMKGSFLKLPCVVLLFLFVFVNTIPTFAVNGYAHTMAFNTATYKQVQICGHTANNSARCLAIKLQPNGPVADKPEGLTPEDLRNAYNLLSPAGGEGQTIAVIDAYDDPNAESDLATYSSEFGLPPCTTTNGRFKKVDQKGGHQYPQANSGWAIEIALDLDMVHAIAPNSHILLVEANSSSWDDLGTAVDTAVRLGANVVSNSYGGQEDSQHAQSIAHYYNHPGVVITASAGDSGYGIQLPAAFKTVIAVGGTSLSRANNSRGWSEKAWGGTGSGCSRYVSKPAWQHDSGCHKRTVADVSAVADPLTGVAVYNTYDDSGWSILGGTSAGAPIIAAVYALAGNAAHINGSYLYNHATNLYDIVGGSNGHCSNAYLCTAVPGYDGPTGLGTPNGIGAF